MMLPQFQQDRSHHDIACKRFRFSPGTFIYPSVRGRALGLREPALDTVQQARDLYNSGLRFGYIPES